MIVLIKKALGLFKNMHLQSLIANGLMSVFGMVTLSLLYRNLSVIDIGIYIFFLAILGLMDTLRSGFLTITFVKFFSGADEERGNAVAGSAWLIALIICGIFLALNIPSFFLADSFRDQGLVFFLKFFGLISAVTLPAFMADCVVQGSKRFDRMLWLRIMTQGSYALSIFTLAILGKITLGNVLLAYVLSNLFSSLMVIFLNWTMFASLKYANKETVKELFHFGKYSVGTNVSANLFNVTNTFILNFLIGPAALAVYNLGSKLMQIVEIPLLSFAISGMPLLSTSYNRGEKKQMIYTLQKLVGMLTWALVPIVILAMIFAEPIIHLVGGKDYVSNEAPNLFRLFIVISLLFPADRFFALAVDVIHLPKVNFYKILIMLVVNIIAVFIAVSLYKSVYSIALASIAPPIIAILMTYIPLNKYSKFSFMSIYAVGLKEVWNIVKNSKKTLMQVINSK